MDFFSSCYDIVSYLNDYLAIPTIILFLGTGIILTIKTRFIQFRAFGKFYNLISGGIKEKKVENIKTISPFQALFSAMATTIGMGNIVGPGMAIGIGGPGALFWILVYIFFGSVTKFAEVTFAVHSRSVYSQGDIIGGPTQYLKLVRLSWGTWYAALTVMLFTVWSSIQVNTLSCIWAQSGIPNWVSGLAATTVLLFVILGGVQRIGYFASRLVPIKFLVYITFALIILFQNIGLLGEAIKLVFSSAFEPQALTGSLAGFTIFKAMREGIYKSIFITEAGVGTSSIAHSLSDVSRPVDQGILAMYSGLADMVLCTLSGLLTIVTGVWQSGKLSNTLIFEAFKSSTTLPGAHIALTITIFLFVITALIGNTYNGSQSFAVFTKYKHMNIYYIFASLIAFSGALIAMPFLWNFMDIILFAVAVPNLLGILYLCFKYPNVIKD